MNRPIKLISTSVIVIFLILVLFFIYYFAGSTSVAPRITWGVDFSQMQVEKLKLNWQDAYLAVIHDLGAKNIQLHTQWDWIEGKKNNFYFDDVDWQIDQAQKNQVNLIYVVGMKSGRWPECHVPRWASGMSKSQQQTEILAYIKQSVLRYKDKSAIIYWQVENEPLFNFGQCPWYDENFLKQEVALVKSLDDSRKVIISDSGEQSSWFEAAKIGDLVGITMYREVWAHITNDVGFNVSSPFEPITYQRKALLVKKIFNKDVICIELQAEPWAAKPFFDVPLSEQAKTMNLEIFKKNVDYAKQTGLDTFYFWGVEWWYWMKTTQNHPEIWNEAKTLFR